MKQHVLHCLRHSGRLAGSDARQFHSNLKCSIRRASFFASSSTDWGKAFSDAERIVGYPTSFLSLRCLLSDELSNVAMQMRKLVGTNHPLMKTAKRFVYDGTHSLQRRALIVLLISKAAGPCPPDTQSDMIETMVSGIYQSQRALAEIAEMIYTAYLVHKGVVNLAMSPINKSLQPEMEFGNKMAILSGDFLLANAATSLAKLKNTHVVELIGSAIRDLAAAEFTRFRNKDGTHILPSDGGAVTMANWEEQTYLSSGSLLAKSCQSAMMLASHPISVQDAAFKFGQDVANTLQIHDEMQTLRGKNDEKVSVSSAAVILHLEKYPDDERLNQLLLDTAQNQKKLLRHLVESGAIARARELCQTYGRHAVDGLQIFPQTEATAALTNIIQTLTNS